MEIDNNEEIIILINKLEEISNIINDNGNSCSMEHITLTEKELRFLTIDYKLKIEIPSLTENQSLSFTKQLEENFNTDTSLTAQSLQNEKINDVLLGKKQDESISEPVSNVNRLSSPPTQSFITIDDYDFVFQFGKHSGQTVRDVLIQNPSYIIWITDNLIKNMRFSQEILNKAIYNNANKKYEPKNSYSRPTIKNDETEGFRLPPQQPSDDLPF